MVSKSLRKSSWTVYSKESFITGMQIWFNIQISIRVNYRMDISMDTDEMLSVNFSGSYLNLIKYANDKSIGNIILIIQYLSLFP